MLGNFGGGSETDFGVISTANNQSALHVVQRVLNPDPKLAPALTVLETQLQMAQASLRSTKISSVKADVIGFDVDRDGIFDTTSGDGSAPNG